MKVCPHGYKYGKDHDMFHPCTTCQKWGDCQNYLIHLESGENNMKCRVHNCTNKTEEGRFMGGICSPCFDYLVNQMDNNSQAKRNNEAEKKIKLPFCYNSYEEFISGIPMSFVGNIPTKQSYAVKKLRYLANILNDGWKVNFNEECDTYSLYWDFVNECWEIDNDCTNSPGAVYFKSKDLAERVINEMGNIDMDYLRGKND
jgi:hypothetical protein